MVTDFLSRTASNTPGLNMAINAAKCSILRGFILRARDCPNGLSNWNTPLVFPAEIISQTLEQFILIFVTSALNLIDGRPSANLILVMSKLQPQGNENLLIIWNLNLSWFK